MPSVAQIDGLNIPGGAPAIPAPAAAYSVRLLDSALGVPTYTGAAMRVRRVTGAGQAGNDDEADVGFDSNDVISLESPVSNFSVGGSNATTLGQFLNVGTVNSITYTDADSLAPNTAAAYVDGWKDQSGNGNDAEQTAPASQPQIHVGTVDTDLILENGKPTLKMVATDTLATSASFSSLTEGEAFIAVRWLGDIGVAVATVGLTLAVLIFAEITPKTVAAVYPQTVAFAVAWPLRILLFILWPLVWLANSIARVLLQMLGVRLRRTRSDHLNREELRTLLNEPGALISPQYKSMLVSVLDLEKVTVEEIMIPRNEIVGIDLSEDWDDILAQLETSQYTRLPIYHRIIDQVEGFVHLRDVMKLMTDQALTKESLRELAEGCYFIPEGTPLHVQLLQFRQHKQRSCLVVDEYGDIQGLVTLEDILEEIVGEFTTSLTSTHRDIVPQADGSVVVDGGITLRELNRQLRWNLPQTGPKTLSGLVIDYLEFIPPVGTCIRLHSYIIEVKQIKDNMVKTVAVTPPDMHES